MSSSTDLFTKNTGWLRVSFNINSEMFSDVWCLFTKLWRVKCWTLRNIIKVLLMSIYLYRAHSGYFPVLPVPVYLGYPGNDLKPNTILASREVSERFCLIYVVVIIIIITITTTIIRSSSRTTNNIITNTTATITTYTTIMKENTTSRKATC